jgi:hypothetical protein
MNARAWDQFLNRFVLTTWFDKGDRPKTRQAMYVLSQRIPALYRNRIPPSTIVYAPSPKMPGEARRRVHPAGPKRYEFFLYLSPMLESMEQSEVETIAAHEFAHLILESRKKQVSREDSYAGGLADQAADKLIEQWGFAPAYKRTESSKVTP